MAAPCAAFHRLQRGNITAQLRGAALSWQRGSVRSAAARRLPRATRGNRGHLSVVMRWRLRVVLSQERKCARRVARLSAKRLNNVSKISNKRAAREAQHFARQGAAQRGSAHCSAARALRTRAQHLW